MKKNFSFSVPTGFTDVKPSLSTYTPAIPMRDATLNAWQGPPGNDLLLQEFDGKYGYLYSYDTQVTESVRISLNITISDMHILYLMEASAEVHLYTAAEELICTLAPQRARHLYLPVGTYILEIPKGDSHLFGFYYDGGIFRDGNERKFPFIHDLIDAYRTRSDQPMCSVELEVGSKTRSHIMHLCNRLRKGLLNNEHFITEHLIKLINLSKDKYQEEYLGTHSNKHILKDIRNKIRDEVGRKGQDFNISELIKTMTHKQNYYNNWHKKQYGITLNQYKIKLILKEAKKQLKLGQSVINCAYHCGFNSLEAFSRFFKRHTGLRPNEYIDKYK